MCGATRVSGEPYGDIIGEDFRYSMNRITPKTRGLITGRTGDAGDYLADGVRPSMTTETPAKGGYVWRSVLQLR